MNIVLLKLLPWSQGTYRFVNVCRYITIILWNINESGSQIKRRKVLAYLKSKNTAVAFIQGFHITGDEEALKYKKGWVGKVFHSSYSSKRNGVMILINKNLSFVMLKQHNDKEGWLCIEALISGIRTVLCNIYATNKEEPSFIKNNSGRKYGGSSYTQVTR